MTAFGSIYTDSDSAARVTDAEHAMFYCWRFENQVPPNEIAGVMISSAAAWTAVRRVREPSWTSGDTTGGEQRDLKAIVYSSVGGSF